MHISRNSIIFATKFQNMAKFKFKGTTTKEVEEELESLCTMNVKEIPLSHIIKIVKVIGVEHITGQTTGSQVRFRHPDAGTYGNYFGVHKIHKGGDEELVAKVNFKKYMMPFLKDIIAKRKQNGI